MQAAQGSNTVLIMGSRPFSIYMVRLKFMVQFTDYKNSWFSR